MTGTPPYDTIASVYDRYWGNEFAEFAQDAFQSQLAGILPRRAAVLDLCCGTGLFLSYLSDLGYEVFGVDESPKMLAIAGRNAPAAELQCADMSGFQWTTRFDAVVCFYNSVNHTNSIDHLQAVLANISLHLAPGGYFLFDYADREAFESHWESQEQIEIEDRVSAMNYAYQVFEGQATCRIDARSMEIRQIALERDHVDAALRMAGLVPQRETSMVGPNPVRGRRLLLARKPISDNINSKGRG